MLSSNKALYLFLALALLLIVVTAFFILNDKATLFLEWLSTTTEERPFLGACLTILALIFLPVPNSILNTLTGSMFGWGMGSLVIWLGLTLGCLFGYAAGQFASLSIIQKLVGVKTLNQAYAKSTQLGTPILILSRPIPVVSELVMLAAGMARYPFWKYTLIISLTNAGIAIAFAGAGNAAIQHHTSFLLIASIGFPFLAWLAYQPLKKKA